MCQYRKTNVPVSENHLKIETKLINLLESTQDYFNFNFCNIIFMFFKKLFESNSQQLVNYLATCWSETLRKVKKEKVRVNVHITNYNN